MGEQNCFTPSEIRMPREIHSSEEFQKFATNAQECRVIRGEKNVKLKLRTPSYLYTFTTNADEADDLIKGLKDIEVIEFGAKTKEESEKKEKASDQSS
ncbi:MAG: hypothetical protein ACYCQJ_13955 [Nitrososphaerales archaeon]